MSESIIIEIPFNEKIERENQRFFFKYLWKRKTTELKKAVIYSIIFLAIGFVPLNDFKQSPIPYIFKYVGFLYIGYIFLIVYEYILSKKKFHKAVEENLQDFKSDKDHKVSIISLNENSLEIKTIFNNFGSVWNKINYKLVDGYLIVGLLKGNLNFVFTKNEFNNSDYETLVNYLQKYSRQVK